MRPQKPAFHRSHCHKFGAHYVSQDWADAKVAVKFSKCGKAHKTEQVEGKAMSAATSTAGKTPLTVGNVQDAVVKALATQRPAAAAMQARRISKGAWKSIQPSEQSLRAKRKTKRALPGKQTTACAEGLIRHINLHAHCL